MSSSSFMSCPRRSDRGTTGWTRKFSAVLNIKQAETRRLNKQATCFCKCWICSSFLTSPASQCCLYWGPVSEPTGSKTLFHFWFPAQTPSLHHYTEQQLYINNNMLVPEEHNFIKTKYETGGRQGRGADEPKWNRTIFFQYQKQGNRNAPSLPKVVPYYTLMYAHKHSLTHTQTQPHAPSIVIKGQNMIVMFSTTASLRKSFICFHGGEHRNKSLEKKNHKPKNIKKWIAQKIYI